MAQYLLSVWHDDTYVPDFTTEHAQKLMAQVGAFNADLQAAGAMVFGGGLMPKSTASVARFADGEVSVSAGPFCASKEQMGGFWIIDVADEASAHDWARRGSAACEGPVEVRPFQG